MRAIRRHSRYAVLALLVLQFFISNRSLGQRPSLITQPVDDAQRVTLKGNVHPLARTQFDRGAAPAVLAMDRMLLVLKRSPEQDAALKKLLDDQQDKHSPLYRKWLTPDQFGMQFGPSDDDIGKVTGWLGLQGFHEVHVSKGRTVIEFSGTAGQVQSALGTTIREYVVAGKSHWANSNDPSIPAALSPVVAGVLTLHNFYKKPQSHLVQGQFTAKALRQSHPEFTSSTGAHALAPADYYTIYNFNPLGSGSSHIAITGRSNINPQDPLYFHYWMYDQATSWDVVVNGPDPGDLGGGEELEADLDITWASVVAPSDRVTLVVSQSTATTDGVDLSERTSSTIITRM
jgi:subtilase family serine protease